MSRVNEADVKKVMRDTGMEYMQAFYHVQGRNQAQAKNRRARDCITMSEWRAENDEKRYSAGYMQGRGAA